ncbi:MAG: CvpA family protein, partial [Proteobacteria bacterium]|nr:CvpA family protein [Pseudomonadota bacterium]MBU1611622.1 CvpA family protein [Pseudomonadota bacterium]
MNIFDIILIAILVLATARGLFKGFVRELVSLGSIALGVFVASRFHDLLTPYLAQYMRNETSAMAASYLVLFLGTVFGAWILAKMFRTWTDDSVAGS